MEIRKSVYLLFILLLWLSPSDSYPQLLNSPVKIFGYFQNSFTHQTGELDEPEQNSFSLQQLNVFFQTDISATWRAFVNVEFLNNFSSTRQWGAANLEEAWVRFRSNEKFNLKLGLQLPIFNHLNEIKNRTPLLPYIVRPLIYETSFNEFIAVEEFAPGRAFLQVYGFLPEQEWKFDYAVYLGNSPNIAELTPENPDATIQTGVDTTATILLGGRIGIRYKEWKIGISATYDKINDLQGVAPLLGVPVSRFKEVPRFRFGADIAFYVNQFSFEAEFITVNHDDDSPVLSLDKKFYYATFGYHVSEPLFVYVSYWLTKQDFPFVINLNGMNVADTGPLDVEVPTIGFAYNVNDRLVLKAQAALGNITQDIPILETAQQTSFYYYAAAVSVMF